jgi:four helix bundle protein
MARGLAAAIDTAIRQNGGSADHWLAAQMHRTATSILDGIKEGLDTHSNSDFQRCLIIARASCTEIRSQLHMALDIGFITQSQFDKLILQASEVLHVLNELRASEFGIGAAGLRPITSH